MTIERAAHYLILAYILLLPLRMLLIGFH